MAFILGIESLEGTVCQARIKEVLNKGKKATHVYKPRSGGINKNLKNYQPHQIEYTKYLNEELLHFFGYVDDGDSDNVTPFFNFDGKADPANVAQMNSFRSFNEKAMKARLY